MMVGVDGLLDRCADFLTFGALAKCQKCKKGDMIFAKHGYSCNGQIDEWTQCMNFETKPLRMKCKIPSDLKKVEFFSKYKSKVEDRAVRPSIPNIVKQLGKDVGEALEPKVTRQREPLYNMHVIAIGQLSTPKDELKRQIQKLGGKLVTKFQKNIAVVISTKDEVEKMNTRMEEAKSFDIQVVGEDFLKAVEKGTPTDSIEKIKSMSICKWGSDPLTRIPQEETKAEKVSCARHEIHFLSFVYCMFTVHFNYLQIFNSNG
jgi:poly [ADP-ribose] polymerase